MGEFAGIAMRNLPFCYISCRALLWLCC